ncbi:MAG: cadherin repeat domain-containing protein [Gammaproteobacteria bacterium]
MTTFNRLLLLVGLISISACGGGGGGGGDSYSAPEAPSNNAPTITNTTGNYSVPENQTSAFTVTASDPDGDSLTFSISGTDSSLFTISSSGVVTFNAAPDYENPSDSGTNNVYDLSASVSDGSLSASKDFMVSVINDTSDDITTEGYDGTYVAAGPVQGATICIEVNAGTCTGAQFTTTSAQDGTFSLTVDSSTTGVLRGEGGFDPVTNLQFGESDSLALGQPVTDQNVVISVISGVMNEGTTTNYAAFKTNLGIDSSFMIRFDNPFSNLDNAAYNKAAVINTQLAVLTKVLETIHTDNDSAAFNVSNKILSSSTEISLGDTTFIKDLLTNYDTDFSPTSDQLVSLSAGISAYMQKINASSSNSHSHFAKAGVSELSALMKAVMDGTSNSDEIDKLVFNTINWINENTSWDGGSITDNEASLSETTYALSNNGSSNYIVDNINTKDTEFIIYVKEGDVIRFDATSSVNSSHPFLMSTENNDMDKSNDIGTSEGWNKDTLTLTVGANTPETLYPHCEFHSGMYTNSKIVKVTSYNQSDIDITNNSSALQVKGTVASGPFKGASGFTYKVYLTSQGGSEHTHTFHEYPGLTFYMPGSQGYHGAETATDDTKFKPKSHYAEDNDSGGGGSTY